MSVRHVDEYETQDAVQQFRSDIASVRSWKPIGWLNQGHYGELLRNNALGGRLTQQIEAFKQVASGSE
jgi:hypothetical protein